MLSLIPKFFGFGKEEPLAEANGHVHQGAVQVDGKVHGNGVILPNAIQGLAEANAHVNGHVHQGAVQVDGLADVQINVNTGGLIAIGMAVLVVVDRNPDLLSKIPWLLVIANIAALAYYVVHMVKQKQQRTSLVRPATQPQTIGHPANQPQTIVQSTELVQADRFPFLNSIVSIQSVSSRAWLDGRDLGTDAALLSDPARVPQNDRFLQWTIAEIPGTEFVKIKSVSSRQWLDGRRDPNSNVLVSNPNRNPDNDNYLKWKLVHIRDNIYGIKSVSSQCWLDGRDDWRTQRPLVSDGARNPTTDRFLQFQISRTIVQSTELVQVERFPFLNSIVSIQSVSSRAWLDGRDLGTDAALLSDPARVPQNDRFLQWTIAEIPGTEFVKIKSVSSRQWLDGRRDPNSL